MSRIKVDAIQGTSGSDTAITLSGDAVTVNGSFTSKGIDDNATSTAITIDSNEKVGIGGSPSTPLHVQASGQNANIRLQASDNGYASQLQLYANNVSGASYNAIQSHVNGDGTIQWEISGPKVSAEDQMLFHTGGTERMRLDSAGRTLMATTQTNVITVDGRHGIVLNDKTNGFYAGVGQFSANGNASMLLNRDSDDGSIQLFFQDAAEIGSITTSGSTVSYNAFSGSHWSRLTDNSKPTILKGTVIETIDEMCDWYQARFEIQEEGETRTVRQSIALPSDASVGDTLTVTFEDNSYTATIIKEADNKHTKCKISDTADSTRVYGVFAAWDNEDDTVNDMYVTAVGTHVVRVHSSVTVSAGDLLTSNGDGTAKVQDDDIIRSKTIGKVLTNIKQETYDDGSYIVPCALYCG